MEEARRLLVRQEADLDSLKGRVGVVLTGSSIVVAVFGAAMGTNLPDRGLAAPSTVSVFMQAVALIAFVLTAFVCIQVLRPLTWHFSHKLHTWIEMARTPEPPTV